LYFDFDNKYKPLIGQEGVFHLPYTVDDPKDASKVFLEFVKDWRRLSKDPEYQGGSLVIDSLTSLDTLATKHFVLLAGKLPDAGPTLPIYGDLSGWYNWFFLVAKAVQDRHVLILAHEYFQKSQEDKVMGVQPLITGTKILNKLPSDFEDLWYLQKKKVGDKIERRLHFEKLGNVQANTSTLSGDSILAPTWEKVMKQNT